MKKNNDAGQTAFTLAEVLITLTIIGVIAAMTIPNLMQSYRKHQVEVGVKEAYSILSNAIKLSTTENGPTNEWNYEYNNTDLAERTVLPYLKTAKKCGFRDTNYECFCNYKALDGNIPTYKRPAYYVILQNGMSLGIAPNRYEMALLTVDIDGPQKGACQLGKDVFVYSLVSENSHFGSVNAKITFLPGGLSPTYGNVAMTKSIPELLTAGTVSGACSTAGGTQAELWSGTQCSAVIARNGWKIPDDYPVKKW